MKFLFLFFFSLCLYGEEQKTLTVFAGIEGIHEAPFSSWKPGDPEPQGLDPDILRLVAQELNVKLNFFKVDLSKGWKDLRKELLEANLVDMLAYAYTVTDERKKSVDFARPYLVSSMNALVLKRNKIKSIKELKPLPVLAFRHTTAYTWAQKHIQGQVYQNFPQGQYVSINKLLKNNTISAYLGDYFSLVKMAKADKDLEVLKEPLQTEKLAIAVPKGKKELLKKINAALLKLEKNGKLQQLKDKHLKDYKP